MSVPGSDLLGMALGIIGSQSVTYYRNTGRTTSAIKGRDIPTFADPATIDSGSVQAVPRSRYAYYGLDVQKNYITWYVEQDVIDIQRDYSGDRLVYGPKLFQLVSKTDWFLQDGWVGVICVEIGAAANAPFNHVPFTPPPPA